MSKYSWFNLGGPAEYLFKPDNKQQLIEFLRENKIHKLKIFIIGAGSNTLIRDKGIKGVVIKLGKGFGGINLINKNTIEVGASVLDRKVANFAKENNISDFEFLSCIPGSIGGAVIMNSGCYENDISKVLRSIKVIDIDECIEKEIKREEIEFYYRGTNLSNKFIITSVIMRGSLGVKEKLEETNRLYRKKKLSQPSQVKHVEVHLKISLMIKKLGNL